MEASVSPLVENRGIPLDVVRHVLWFRGDALYAVQPGQFVARLLSTLSCADEENRELLRKAFPEYVAAWELFRTEGDEALYAIAKAAAL